jgi:hypothetical protein
MRSFVCGTPAQRECNHLWLNPPRRLAEVASKYCPVASAIVLDVLALLVVRPVVFTGGED